MGWILHERVEGYNIERGGYDCCLHLMTRAMLVVSIPDLPLRIDISIASCT